MAGIRRAMTPEPVHQRKLNNMHTNAYSTDVQSFIHLLLIFDAKEGQTTNIIRRIR